MQKLGDLSLWLPLWIGQARNGREVGERREESRGARMISPAPGIVQRPEFGQRVTNSGGAVLPVDGTEMPTSVLENTVFERMKSPHVMRKVQAKVRNIVPKG